MPGEIYCVIPDNKRMETESRIKKLKAAVFVCLFYEEQLAYYQKYLAEIPEYIDIILISSKDKILEIFESGRYKKIKKENRGRDISALLVSISNLIFHYEYVCFIHDKKERKEELKEYVDLWRENLWSNMLQSQDYIYNILGLFECNERLGMLAPLPPHMGDQGVWLNGSWGETFGHIKNLSYELGLETNLSFENPPVAYSTVFWARSVALKKLYCKSWKYTDFPDEPMKDTGEINHAIERILQYIVEDAGYEVRIALSSSFAASFIGQLHGELKGLWRRVEETIGAKNYDGIDRYVSRVKKILNFGKIHSNVYLYGAGKRGRECLKICRLLDITPDGFLVTEKECGESYVDGIPVFSIADFLFPEGAGVILSAGAHYQEEMKETLRRKRVKEYIDF